MALRPEKKQINYQSQIGVTRGRGFQAMASAGQNRANALDSISEAYSARALKYIQEKGTKLGETAAQDAKFVDQEISFVGEGGVNQTIKTRGVLKEYEPVTKSEQEAYDNDIAKRYANENYLAIASSLDNDKLEAISSNSSGSSYAIIAEAQLAAVLDSDVLPPKTKALLEIQARDKMLQDINQIEINYAKHVKKQIETNNKNNHDSILNTLAQGEDVDEELLDDLRQSEYYQSDKLGIENSINAFKFYGNFVSSIAIGPEATLAEVQQQIADANMFHSMLNGSIKGDITLSSGKVITKSDILDNIPTQALLNTLLKKNNSATTALTKKLEMLKTEAKNSNVVNSVVSNTFTNQTHKDLAKAYNPNDVRLQGLFKDNTGNNPNMKLDGDIGEIWYYGLTGVIPESKAKLLDNLAARKDYEGLFKHQQFLVKLSNNEGLRRNQDGSTVIVKQNLLEQTNLSSETKELLKQIEIGRKTGYSAEAMTTRFKKFDEFKSAGLKMTYEKYGNNVEKLTERNELITEGIEEYVGGVAFSPAFMAGVRKEISSYEMRNSGSSVDRGLYKNFIQMALESIDHSTSVYGKSDTTVGPFTGSSDEAFVAYDAHKLYAVNESSDWINPIIQKSIDESVEIKRLNVDGKKVSANFRKEVKLSPAGSGEPMFYYLYYKDSTGQYRTLNDDNGMIVIDLSKELLAKKNKLSSKADAKRQEDLNNSKQKRADFVEGEND